jgi:UDP-glucose 4-epimerase
MHGTRVPTVLITGGAGFFGGVLTSHLLAQGIRCVSVDVKPHWISHPNLRAVLGDITDERLMGQLLGEHDVDGVVHCAAVLAHGFVDRTLLWRTNVDGTRTIAKLMAAHRVPKMVFISSNCLWAQNFHRPVREDDAPSPIEIYGQSKWAAEKILDEFREDFDSVVLRSPTIIDSGRLGLLAILFDFIREGRRVWTVGGGENRYQFVYAPDLAQACLLALRQPVRGVYNVGSDDVKPLRDVYEYVVCQAGSRSRVSSLPKRPTVALMRLARALRMSPLGPYHYRMIAEDFIFDTSKIKEELGWRPTLSNEEMLYRAYRHYEDNLNEIRSRTDTSTHRQPAKMGVIRVLKWIS